MKNKKKHEKIENQMQKKKSPSILAIVIKFNRYNLLFRIQNLQIVCVCFLSPAIFYLEQETHLKHLLSAKNK